MKLTVSRRSFVKTFAGLGAGGLQFRGLLRDAFVAAAPSDKLRLIVLTSPHGKTVLWKPRAQGGGPAGETGWTLDFDPDACLGPLEKHKDSLVVIDGLDIYSVYKPGSTGSIAHHGAIGVLTGTDIRSNSDRRPTGPSLDTFVARLLKVEPVVFRFHQSVCGSWDANGESFAGFGDGVVKAYQSLFGAGPAPGPSTDDRTAAARANAEAAVWSHLRADAQTLRRRLAGPERRKLDLHLESLDLIERKLSPRPVTAGCKKPPMPAAARDTDLDPVTRHRLVLEMFAAIAACNLTRVATFHMSPGAYYPFLDVGGGKPHVHNDIVHNMRDDPADANTRYTSRVHRWYAAQVANLVDMLKAIPEGAGTAYDNTIVLWTNELGNAAAHHVWNVPFVLAGGGGAWRKGRFIELPGGGGSRGEMAAHNRLLVSIANQFGANVQAFGDPSLAGELPGL